MRKRWIGDSNVMAAPRMPPGPVVKDSAARLIVASMYFLPPFLKVFKQVLHFNSSLKEKLCLRFNVANLIFCSHQAWY